MRFLLAFAQGGLFSPLLPLFRDTFGVSYSALGLLTSMFGLSCVVMDVLATYLLSRRSVLTVLLQGIVITLIGLLCCTLAPGFYWLVGARVLLGFGVSMTGVASLMVVVTTTPRSAQGRASSLLEFAAIAGSTITPTLSGLVASLLHWRAACGLGALFVGGALAWVLCTRRTLAAAVKQTDLTQRAETNVMSPATSSVPLPASGRHAIHAVGTAYLAAFVLSFTWAGFLSTALPLFGSEVVGVSISTLGMVFTAGLLVDLGLLLPVGWLSDRLDYRKVLTPAMLLMAATLAWMPHVHTLRELLLASICLHTGFAAWGMPSAALVLLTPGKRLARTMGLYRLLVDGAVIVAPWLMGILIERYGYNIPARSAAVLVACTALLVAWGLRPSRA
jgi:predicted MFS family arabinose efflux permease